MRTTFRTVQAVTGLYFFFSTIFQNASAPFENEYHFAAVAVGMHTYGCTRYEPGAGQYPVGPVKEHSGFQMFVSTLEG